MHLDGWVIEALERGDYLPVGPPVYVKGHLKRYAELLGLPPAEILEAYAARPPAAAADAAPAPPVATPPALPLQTPAVAGRRPVRASIAALAVLALVAAGLYGWQTRQPNGADGPRPGAPLEPEAAGAVAADDVEVPPALASATLPATAAAPVPTAPPAAAARPAAPRAAAPIPTAPPAASARPAAPPAAVAGTAESTVGAGRARLRLSFSADSWVDVHDAAGRRLFTGKGRANSVKTIAGEAPMRVYLGFASGVQVQLNDHVVAIGPQFVAGDAAHFEAGADGVLRRDAHAATAGNPHPHG
jgi:cytoskeletal protein RodZ